MADLIRDAPMGQVIRWITKNKYFKYPEEREDFQLPEPWIQLLNGESVTTDQHHRASGSGSGSDASTAAEDKETRGILRTPSPSNGSTRRASSPSPSRAPKDDEESASHREDAGRRGRTRSQDHLHHHDEHLVSHEHAQRSELGDMTARRLEEDEEHELEKTKSIPIVPQTTKDGAILVDWYYTDDPDNPYNWTRNKRLTVNFIICIYTFVVYTTSAIYTTSEGGIMNRFHVSEIKATLGLSIYVLGYGVGPLLFSPLSEIPVIGRNPVYIVTMFLFVIISIPTAFAPNYPGLMVLRFLQGFFGSPCLASGGASLGDMYTLMALPYAMMSWVAAAYCGRKSYLFLLPPSPPYSPLLLLLPILPSTQLTHHHSRPRPPPQRLRRPRRVLALVPLRVPLGLGPRLRRHVPLPPRDEQRNHPAAPRPPPAQAHRQRALHVPERD